MITDHIPRNPLKLSIGKVAVFTLLFLIPMTSYAQLPVELQFSGEWRTLDPEGGSIKVAAMSSVDQDLGMSNRTLFLWRNTARAVLDVSIDVEAAALTMRLTDENSGWWIELAEDYGDSWSTLKQGFNSISEYRFAVSEGDEAQPLRVSMRSRERIWFDDAVLVDNSAKPYFDLIEASGVSNSLSEAVPQNTREILCLLKAAEKNQDLEDLQALSLAPNWALAKILNWVTKETPADPCVNLRSWSLAEYSGMRVLSAVEDPDLIEMVSKFSSLDNVDPMKGFRPQDIFGVKSD